MPSKGQILNLLASEATEATPMHRNKIAEKLGENSYRSFQTQLDRFEKQQLIDGNAEHEYFITELGIKDLTDQSIVTEETDEEKLGTTEYQRFIHLGKITGVSPPELIKQTADHLWNGGNFTDLDWVARALQEMGIRQDLRNRWWHSWRTYLHQPMPSSMPAAIVEGEAGADGKPATKGKGSRDYILDADDKPVFVGTGLGDMDFDNAMELAKIRGGRGSRVPVGAQQTPGSMADEMVKLFGAFQSFMGDRSQGKSYMVRQGEDGLQVEEVDPGRPMILNNPQGNNKPSPTFFVGPEGEVQEVQPGQPIIIKQPAPPQASGGAVQYLIDKATGQVQTVQPGQPIVIQAQPPQSQYPYTPIQMKDKDGNPMVLDLSTFIRLEEHRDKQRRDEESHETKQEIAKSFKDLIGKATSALGHMEQ